MTCILNIDSALETASVCLSRNGEPIGFAENNNPKDHSRWLHSAIKELLNESGYAPSQLDAVSVNTGPGSYTGLRTGLSAAKGLCYALNKPLIAISSLELIAFANKQVALTLLCPVIDARRMEVYFAVYNKEMELLQQPAAHIITQNSFAEQLESHAVLFCGTGSKKLQTTICHPNAMFSDICGTAKELAVISFNKYLRNDIASLADTDPLYIKDFYTTGQKP